MASADETTPVYSIGSVARMLGVSVQTLRLYETEGLILARKSPGGQRLYARSDVDRLECIRRAITEEKISIAGIRHMQALVPCWRIMSCSPEQRQTCPAFLHHDRGCWNYRHADNACAGRDCHGCQVYQVSTSCAGIKQVIQQFTDQPGTSPQES